MHRQPENYWLLNYLPLTLVSLDTVNFLRPFFLRAANTLRPLGVVMRSLNPCLFLRLRLEGWYVRFIVTNF